VNAHFEDGERIAVEEKKGTFFKIDTVGHKSPLGLGLSVGRLSNGHKKCRD
jgi:hypothetical protein